ncbi:Hypothetical predicted protein [Olea europaea subsp. europaea]|uniref:Uncharacterized protein n=1 Tax=Olea europaea subsp. europaea TaxID=158383 RepID=A0A8S0RR59_OLEEU|nr:Hypothetical predicted protein [Olea europaea subsp. europaea]
MSVQRREQTQPRRDRADDCGIRGAVGDRKRGASRERLEGRDREKEITLAAKRERSQPRRDWASDCGDDEDGDVRKRGASGEHFEGRVIAVRAYFMSVQRRERSQPRRDRASDCGVRGAGGDPKRGASGERLKGWDREIEIALAARREKNCTKGEKSAAMVAPINDCGPRVFDVSPAQGAIVTVEGQGRRLWGQHSRWRSNARDQQGAFRGAFSAGSDRNHGGTRPAIVGSAKPTAIESEGAAGSAWRGGIGKKIALAAKRVKKLYKRRKGVQHEDFPSYPSQYNSRSSTLNFGVLMGSGALVLSRDRAAIVGSVEPVAIEMEGRSSTGSDRNRGGPGQRLWGPLSRWQSKARGLRGALEGAG